MDKNHIAYCIKLGNPYMQKEHQQEPMKAEELDFSWIPETEDAGQDNWLKNTKKFTN